MKTQAEQNRQDRDSLLQIFFKTFLYTVFTLLHTHHLFLLPILLAACQENEAIETEIMTRSVSGNTHIERLDIYSYTCVKGQRINTFQSIENPKNLENIILKTGRQRIVAIGNLDGGIPTEFISSISSLNKYSIDFCNEDPELPVMIADTTLDILEDSKPMELKFTPLLCRIRLGEIIRNFKGKPYENSPIENIRIYLTNVLKEQTIIQSVQTKNQGYINFRGLSEQDLEELEDPSAVYMDSVGTLAERAIKPKGSFYCYPNPAEKESTSEAMTRLVIEGEIDGTTYYYPINIFRDGHTMESNTDYVFDITIKSLGNLDPDTEANPLQISIDSSIEKWKEDEEKNIIY